MIQPGRSFKIVSELINFIHERGYEPGERLPSERDLTVRFNVGRGMIREALVFLEATRFIVRRPNSGIFLSEGIDEVSLETLVLHSKFGVPLDEKTMFEITEVRAIMELQAIEIACVRHTAENAEAFQNILLQTEELLKQGASIADLDYEFHMEIFHATQNDIFARMVTPFYLMSGTRRNAFFFDHQKGIVSHEQHKEITEAIIARDVERARELMSSHIVRVEKHFLTNIAETQRRDSID